MQPFPYTSTRYRALARLLSTLLAVWVLLGSAQQSQAQADLSLTMTVDNNAPIQNTEITFTLDLANGGSKNANNIDVGALLPAGLTYVSDTPSQGTYDNVSGLWAVGSVKKNNSATLTLVTRLTTSSVVTFAAEVTNSSQSDPDSVPGNGDTGEDDYDSQTITPLPMSAVDECYLVADSGDLLTWVVRTTGVETSIGLTGTTLMEATAYWPGTDIMYAADADRLGTLDYTGSGAFTVIGNFGIGDGAEGPITLEDVDGLAFDPLTGILYGAHRRVGTPNQDDLLFQISTTTGAYIPDAFGPGVDYVVVNANIVTGFPDIDDLAIDPYDGQLYGIANDGGAGDRLVMIDKTTGAVTDVGALGQNDMESLSFDAYGTFYGTTGTGGGTNADAYFTIDKVTGTANFIASLTAGTDYESISCLTDGVNTISGTVFEDIDVDGLYTPATDLPTQGLTVELYRDVDNNGVVDPTDVLIATVPTDASGAYDFTVASEGAFVLQLDTSGLDAGASLTTAAVQEADFLDFGNADPGNDFGYQNTVDLALTQTVDNPTPTEGENVTFTLTLTNEGVGTAGGVAVEDLLPAGLTFVSATPSQGTYNDTSGLWSVGTLAPSGVVTLTITATVDTDQPVTNIAQVSATNQADTDSTPANSIESEDDQESVSLSPSGSSGGGDGGLESNGTLAQTIAYTRYRRRIGRKKRGDTQPPAHQRDDARTAKGAFGDLLSILPDTGPQQSKAYVVSPTDLLPVTNAADVFALDYIRPDQRRLAAIFAAQTQGQLYEHTKVICDRLKGARLRRVEHVTIRGGTFVMAQLEHPDGSVDYAVSLVGFTSPEGLTLDSRFRLEEYALPSPDTEVLNLQVWSVAKSYTVALVEAILDELIPSGVTYRNTAKAPPPLPQVYVRTGRYEEGQVVLEVFNAAGAETLRLTGGTRAAYEGATRQDFTHEVALPRPSSEATEPVVEVTIPFGPLFDIAFFLETDASPYRDQLYLADGAWAFVADEEGADVDRFNVQPEATEAVGLAGKRAIERPIALSGDVRTWVRLFRYLQPSGVPVDLTAYQYIEFTAYGQGQLRMQLEQSDEAEGDHFGHILRLTEAPKTYRIWFEDLRRGSGLGSFSAEDVVLLSFNIVGQQGRSRPFDIAVENVRFGGAEGDRLAEVPETMELKQNYPNPFNPETTIRFGFDQPTWARVAVYDMLGRRVAVVAEQTFREGRHAVRFEAGTLASGMYLYRLETDRQVITRMMALLR